MSEWISIKDKLPPEKKIHSIYLVMLLHHVTEACFVFPMHWINGQWFDMHNEGPLDLRYEVTHWMPLPEPPK